MAGTSELNAEENEKVPMDMGITGEVANAANYVLPNNSASTFVGNSTDSGTFGVLWAPLFMVGMLTFE